MLGQCKRSKHSPTTTGFISSILLSASLYYRTNIRNLEDDALVEHTSLCPIASENRSGWRVGHRGTVTAGRKPTPRAKPSSTARATSIDDW